MFAKELISDDISPLQLTDTVEQALTMMQENKVKQLPIVDSVLYYGLLSENSIIEFEDKNILISEILHLVSKKYIEENQHLYEAIYELANSNISLLPVVDTQMKYLGCILPDGLIKDLSKFSAINQSGGIIVLEMNVHDYSLGHIAQLVEENDTRILSSFVYSIPNSTQIELHLKLNRTDISTVINTLERFGYNIKVSITDDVSDELNDRYSSFMKYLSI